MEQNERNFWITVLGLFLFGFFIGLMAGISLSML